MVRSRAKQFLDVLPSPAGRADLRDVLLGDPDTSDVGRCSAYAAEQIDIIVRRAADRGQDTPEVETVIDRVVVPLIYRVLFRPDGLDTAYAHNLVAGLPHATALGTRRPCDPGSPPSHRHTGDATA